MEQKDELLTALQLSKRWHVPLDVLKARRSKKQGPAFTWVEGRPMYELSEVVDYEQSLPGKLMLLSESVK